MSPGPYAPERVMPAALAEVVATLPYWFVIGGQAVRCLCPYRPSRDVDFGVRQAADLADLLAQLGARGQVEIVERSEDTVHLLYDGVRVSIFVLDELSAHVEQRRLDVTGILATKMHAILDRGTRRDFFDLYVTMQRERLGIAEALAAMRRVFRQDINEPLLLRALTYFDDADREAALAGEGERDWATVQDFLLRRVGDLLVPPSRPLDIQARVVDLREA